MMYRMYLMMRDQEIGFTPKTVSLFLKVLPSSIHEQIQREAVRAGIPLAGLSSKKQFFKGGFRKPNDKDKEKEKEKEREPSL